MSDAEVREFGEEMLRGSQGVYPYGIQAHGVEAATAKEQGVRTVAGVWLVLASSVLCAADVFAAESPQHGWEQGWYALLEEFKAAPNDVVREEVVRKLEHYGGRAPAHIDRWVGTLSFFRYNPSETAVGGLVTLVDAWGGTPHQVLFFSPVRELPREVYAKRASLRDGILVEVSGARVGVWLPGIESDAGSAAEGERGGRESPALPKPPSGEGGKGRQPKDAEPAQTAGAAGTQSLGDFMGKLKEFGFAINDFVRQARSFEVTRPAEAAPREGGAEQPSPAQTGPPRKEERRFDPIREILERNPQFKERIPKSIVLLVQLRDIGPMEASTRRPGDVARVSEMERRLGELEKLYGELRPAEGEGLLSELSRRASCEGLISASQRPECSEALLRGGRLGLQCPGGGGVAWDGSEYESRRAALRPMLDELGALVAGARFEEDYGELLQSSETRLQELEMLRERHADCAYLSRCLPKVEMPASKVLGVSIGPPEPFSWGMTSEAAKGKLKLGEVIGRDVRYHGLPGGLRYLRGLRNIAGERCDVILAFDDGGLLMVEFNPIMTVVEGFFEKEVREALVEARRVWGFWSEVSAGVTAKYGSPLEVGMLGRLEPGQESKTMWRDGAGNEVWLSLRREPRFAHYQLRLRYVSKEGLARLAAASGKDF